jgi:hypothetical protein
MTKRKSHQRLVALTLLVLCAPQPPAGADAIVVTQAMLASTVAEIFVEETSVRMEIEIGVADLGAFANLMPDELYERLGNAPAPLKERIPLFFREDLVLRVDDGAPLSGRIVEIGPRPRTGRDEITGEPLPPAEDEKQTVVFARLEYALPERPRTLTIEAPLTAGPKAAGIGFVTYHRDLPVMDFRYMTQQQTLDLDWEDPWFSAFRHRNLRRQYEAPIHAFLYVEPYEVRVEVIARPRDLEPWLDLGIEGSDTLPVELQPDLKEKIGAFLPERFELEINGSKVVPTLDRIHFLRRTLRNSTVIDPPEVLATDSATLGAIYVHPTAGLPQEANVVWTLFSPKMQKVPAAATDEAGPLKFILQPDDNRIWWRNVLTNPTLPTLVDVAAPPRAPALLTGWLVLLSGLGLAAAALLVGAGFARGRGARKAPLAAVGIAAVLFAGSLALDRSVGVSDDEAGEIVDALLRNVYRSFDFREESAIYDVLDRSVEGDLLEQIYLETRRGLELQSQGGARAKVKEIELVEIDPQPLDGDSGFRAHCVWNVRGSVGHWGHIHERINRYVAEVEVRSVDGDWKIAELDVLEEERL